MTTTMTDTRVCVAVPAVWADGRELPGRGRAGKPGNWLLDVDADGLVGLSRMAWANLHAPGAIDAAVSAAKALKRLPADCMPRPQRRPNLGMVLAEAACDERAAEAEAEADAIVAEANAAAAEIVAEATAIAKDAAAEAEVLAPPAKPAKPKAAPKPKAKRELSAADRGENTILTMECGHKLTLAEAAAEGYRLGAENPCCADMPARAGVRKCGWLYQGEKLTPKQLLRAGKPVPGKLIKVPAPHRGPAKPGKVRATPGKLSKTLEQAIADGKVTHTTA